LPSVTLLTGVARGHTLVSLLGRPPTRHADLARGSTWEGSSARGTTTMRAGAPGVGSRRVASAALSAAARSLRSGAGFALRDALQLGTDQGLCGWVAPATEAPAVVPLDRLNPVAPPTLTPAARVTAVVFRSPRCGDDRSPRELGALRAQVLDEKPPPPSVGARARPFRGINHHRPNGQERTP
jgi:hypothetical protein